MFFYLLFSSVQSVDCEEALNEVAFVPSWRNDGTVGYREIKSEDYRGCQMYTRSGRLCQNWDATSPHSHSYTPWDKPNSGLTSYYRYRGPGRASVEVEGEAHNFCRDPSGSGQPWCYTTDPRSEYRWEYCDPIGTDDVRLISLSDFRSGQLCESAYNQLYDSYTQLLVQRDSYKDEAAECLQDYDRLHTMLVEVQEERDTCKLGTRRLAGFRDKL